MNETGKYVWNEAKKGARNAVDTARYFVFPTTDQWNDSIERMESEIEYEKRKKELNELKKQNDSFGFGRVEAEDVIGPRPFQDVDDSRE